MPTANYNYPTIESLPPALRACYDALPFSEAKSMLSVDVAEAINKNPDHVTPALSTLIRTGWVEFKPEKAPSGRTRYRYWACEHRRLVPQLQPTKRKKRSRTNGSFAAKTAASAPAPVVASISEELERVAVSVNSLLHAVKALEAEQTELAAIKEAIQRLTK